MGGQSNAVVRNFFLGSLVLMAVMFVWRGDATTIALDGYLPVHTLMEAFSVVICALIFSVGWKTFNEHNAQALSVLACALLGVGMIDIAHSLSYPGMPDFVTPNSAQKSIFFWLSARSMLALALLYTAIVRWRSAGSPHFRYILLAAVLSLAAVCLWVGFFHLDWIPPLYAVPAGLTGRKIFMEALICAGYGVSGAIFAFRFAHGADKWMRDLAICCGVMALSEVYFALFRSHADLLNILGHVYKVIAYSFLYRSVFMYGVSLPMDLLKKSEAALRASQKALRTTKIAVDRSNDHVFMFDARGRFSYVNGRAIERLGYSFDELLTMSVSDIDVNYRGAAWIEHWAGLLQSRAMMLETTHRARNGEQYPVEVSVTLIAEAGEEPFACAIVRDISERVRTERQLRESFVSVERARAEARAKGEFLARMSHEIRTPMNGVLGMSELLLNSGLNSQQEGYCRIVHTSAEALLGVINDILDISKLEAGKLRIERIAFAIQGVVDDVVNLLQLRADEKGILMLSRVEPDVPAWVIGDPTRIRQILINFVSNAIKFTDTGTVTLSVVPGGVAGVRFSVEDTGRGIAADAQQSLFEPFAQADAAIARTHGGTGLGLAIAKELATLMGGAVGFRSQLGHGSQFWVELPLPATHAPARMSPADLPAGGEHPLSLLVVDDNQVNQMVIQAMLRKLGHICQLASSGDSALNIYTFRHAQFDAILMDCEMPGVDGFETTRLLRRFEESKGLRQCPIIAVTANALEDARQRAMVVGMNGYLAKPLTLSELAEALSAIAAP